jgi:hypothetical protein
LATQNQTLEDKRAVLFHEGVSKLRRFWLVKARRRYVKSSISLRKGACARCGKCCKVFFKCPFLRGNACAIYERRFEQCTAFPIDRTDIALIRKMGGKCGFSFSGNGK